MTTWNLTQSVLVANTTPTLFHNADGDCWILRSTSVLPIEAIWIEVPEADTAATVSIVFEPDQYVDPLNEGETDTTLVPYNHGGVATWSSTTVGGVTRVTIAFPIPGSSRTMWGWDFNPGNHPSPLKMKVRVKRL